MRTRHEFRLDGMCPVDESTDRYDVVVETSRLISVEKILEVAREVAAREPAYQEEITREIANRLVGVKVTTTGVHSGVTTTCEAGPSWEKELESGVRT